jgi:hypothetical protein
MGRDEPTARHLSAVTPRISLSKPTVLVYHCRELAVLAYMQKEKA